MAIKTTKPRKMTKARASSNVKKALRAVGKATGTKRRGRPKSNKIKPVAYRAVLRGLETYEHNLATGKENRSDVVEKLKRDIAPYLTKNGELRKNISQKKLEEFNAIIKAYKMMPQSTAAFRKKAAKDKRHEAVYAMTKDKRAGRLADELFEDKLVQKLLKSGAIGYENVFEIADKYSEHNAQYIINNALGPAARQLAMTKSGRAREGYEEVAEAILEYDDLVIPSSSRKYRDQDDFIKDLQKKLANMRK